MKKKNKKRKILNSISILFLTISIILVIAISWYKHNFNSTTLEELIFHLKVPLEGSNLSFIDNFIIYAENYILFILAIIILINIYHSDKFKHKYQLKVNITFFNQNKTIKINIKDDRNIILIVNTIMLITSLLHTFNSLNVKEYIKNNLTASTIFENYYIDTKNVKLEFPEQKQNLIYIYLESMESSFSNLYVPEINSNNLIPNLEKLAYENISFSNTTTLGGAKQLPGTTWTIAAMVAHSAGIPLKISIDENSLQNFSEFLPGAYTLGDILEKEGYKQYIMIGSDIVFGGRKNYFTQHGNFEIFDYNTAIEKKLINEDYYVWWGYEDEKLFQYAQEKLTDISKNNEPFNFTMLTADTHFLEGYTDDSCKQIHKNEYANAVTCSDNKIYNFINWIKQQDFYKNTTIIIVGDHLLMGNYLYPNTYEKERYIYNAIINSKITTNNTQNRIFTTLDLFPTTLASLGVKIEGDRLGLGTNLFSNKQTLSEELGFKYLKEQMKLKSNYYNKNILYTKKG